MSPLRRLRPVALAFCAVCTWGAAQAAVVTQSKSFTSAAVNFGGFSSNFIVADGSFYRANFDPFDSSLGTLTGAKIRWSADVSLTYTVTGDASNNGSVFVNGGGVYTVNNVGYFGSGFGSVFSATGADGLQTAKPSVTSDKDFLVGDTSVSSNTLILAAMQGTGPVTLAWQTNRITVGFNRIESGSAVANGQVTLDYFYTAAPSADVPEPDSLALALGALLTAAAVRRAKA